MTAKSPAAQPRVVTIRLGGRKATLTWRPRKRISALLQRMMARAWQALVAAVMAGATGSVFAAPPAVNALPTGGQVVAGQATITQSGSGMTIVQGTDKAILNWGSFDIGSQASVDFRQPGVGSVALNRVMSNEASQIFGSLTANGSVFLVNPNGVVFGAGSRVDVGGLVASTMNIKDSDFLDGKYVFTRDGATGSILNQGNLQAGDRGYIALLAPEVINEGVIAARLGTVAMAAGEAVTLDMSGDGLMTVKVDPATLRTLVENRLLVQADGGRVIMAASAANALLGASVNSSGTVQARGLVERDGGIYLDAGANGDAVVSGTLDVSSSVAKGGTVQVTGQRVGLFDGTAIDASGATGGGTVLAGGDFQGGNAAVLNATQTAVGATATIKADATGTGDGGKVVVWADGTTAFAGTISARGGATGGDGGAVEVSGKDTLGFAGMVDAGADLGKGGTLLLDPKNITVATGGTGALTAGKIDFTTTPSSDYTIDAATITNVTKTGTAVTLQANNDLTVNNSIITVPNGGVARGGALSLEAGRNIVLNSNINSADGNVSFTFNSASATQAQRDAGSASFINNSSVDAGSGTVTITNGNAGASDGINTGKISAATLTVTHGAGATGGVTLGELFTTATLNVNSAGKNITTGTRSVVSRGNAIFNAGTTGDITLINASSDYDVVSSTARNVTIVDLNAVQLGASTVGGNLSVTTNGAMQSTGVLTVTGTSTFTANNGGFGTAAPDITLNTNNDFQGQVTLNSASGSVAIRDINALSLGVVKAANFTANTGGALTSASTIDATSMNLTSAGAINASGVVTVTGNTVIAAGANDVTMTNANNDFGNYVQITSAKNASLVDKNAFTFGYLGDSVLSGSLSLTAGGDISQYNYEYNSSALKVAGDATFTMTQAGKNLYLGATDPQNANTTGAANSIGGTVTLATTGSGSFQDVQLRNINTNAAVLSGLDSVGALRNVKLKFDSAPSVTLPGMTLTGNLSVSALNGSIGQSGAIVVAGVGSNGYTSLQAASTKDVTLTNAGNDFNRMTVVNARNASLVDKNGIELSSLNSQFLINGDLSVTAAGNITQNSNYQFSVLNGTATFNAGTADVSMTGLYTNRWKNISVTAARNAVFRSYVGNVALADIDVTGNLSLTSDNYGYALSQVSGTSAKAASAGTTTFSGFSTINLAAAENVFGNLALSGETNVTLRENDAVTQASAWSNGATLDVTTSNDQAITLTQTGNYFGSVKLTQVNNGAASAGDVSLRENDIITQSAAWTTHGNTTVNAGINDIALTHTGNTLGALKVTGATVAITARDTAGKDAITDFSNWSTGATTLTAYNTTGTTAGAGNVSLTNASNVLGDLTVKGNTVTITENDAITDGLTGWTTTGTTTLNAGTKAINLDNTTNVLGAIAIGGAPSSVTITDNSDITQASAWTVGSAPVTLNATNHAIDLSTAGNVLGAIAIQTANGTPTSVSIRENDAITQNGDWNLLGKNVTLHAENGKAITLTNVGNQMGNLTVTGGAVSITENDNITQNGAWTTTGVTTLTTSASNSITLNNAANSLGALALSGASSVAITENDDITQASAWSLPTSTVALNAGTHDIVLDRAANRLGDLTLTAANATVTENDLISDGGAWKVTGLTTLTAGTNNIVLDANPKNELGTVKIVSAGTADITTKNGVIFDTSTVTGAMSVNAGGAITQIGAIKADSLLLTGTGSATLNHVANNVRLLSAGFSGGDLSYVDADDVAIANLGSTTGINIGANDVTLRSVAGTVTGLSSVNSVTSSLSVQTQTALSLPAMSIAGAQTYQSATGIVLNAGITSTQAGAIKFIGPVSLANDLTIQSSNSLVDFSSTLAGASKQLTVNAGTGAAAFHGAVSGLGTSASGNPVLQLTSGGAVFDDTLTTNNGITITGAATFKNDVTLGNGNAASVFTDQVTFAKAGAQTLSGYNGMSFRNGMLLQGGAVTINSNNGAIALSGTGTVRGAYGLSLNAGTGAITGLDRIGTDLTSLAVTGASLAIPGAGISIAGAQSYTATGGTSITLNGNLTSTAAGAITLTGPVNLAANSSITSVNSAVTFNGTVDGARDLAVNSGTATKTFNGKVGSVTSLGDGTGAALTLTGTGATSFTDTVVAKSGISAAGAVGFANAVTLANGDTGSTFTGRVTLGNTLSGYDGINFIGGLSLTGNSTVISNGGTIAFGNSVTGTSKLTLNALAGGTGAITGLNQIANTLTGLSLTAQSLNLPAGLSVAGAMDFTAPGGITVNSALGNVTNGGQIDFNSTVTLASDSAISTANAAVNFNAALNGGARNLTLTTGTGAKTFNGAVSNVGSGTGAAITLQGSGATTFGSTLGANSGLLVQNGANLFLRDDVVLADGSVGSNFGTGVTTIGRIGATTTVSGFDGLAFGALSLDRGAVSLVSNNGAVTFAGAVNGPNNLAINAGSATTTFSGAVGATQAVGTGTGAALAVTGTGLTTFASTVNTNAGITVAGDATFQNNATLGGTTKTTVGGTTTLGRTGGMTVAAAGGATFNNVALVGGATTISSAAGDLTVNGGINGAQALTVNAGTGAVKLNDIGAATALASLNASGASIQAGAVTTTGSQTYTATNVAMNGDWTATGLTVNGKLAVNSPATSLNARTGTLALNGTVAFDGSELSLTGDEIDLGGKITGTGALNVAAATAGRGINLGGTTTTTDLDLTATELGYLPNGLTRLTVGNATAGNINLLGNVNVGTAALSLATSGNIQQVAGSLTSGALSLSAPVMISLTGSGNAFDAVSLLQPAFLVSLTNTRDIRQGNAWVLPGASVTLDAGSRDILLTNTGNVLGAVTLKGRNAQVVEADAITLGASTLTGDLALTAAGAITLQGATNVGGKAAMTAAGTIGQAASAKLTVGGDLSLTTTQQAGNVAIDNRGATATVIGETLIGGNYTLNAAGQSVTQAVDTSAKVAGAFTPTGASVNVGNTGNIFGSLSIQGASGTTVIKQNGVITLTDRVETGNLSVISEASSSVFTGPAIGGSAVALNNASNSIGGRINVTTAAPAIAQGGADVQTGIVQAAGTSLKVTGEANFIASSSSAGTLGVNLSNAGNSFGSLKVSGDTINVAATGTLTVTGAQAVNGLRIDSTGNLVVNGAVGTAAGDASLTSGGNLTLATGSRVSAATGGIVLATGSNANFINNAGATALTVGTGKRWLVYVGNKTGNVFGNLDSQNTAVWNATTASLQPGAVTQSGNRYLFNASPVLTLTGAALTKTYGDTIDLSNAYTISGLETGVTGAYRGDTLATVLAGAPNVTSTGAATTANVAASPYTIDLNAGTLVASNGYTLGSVTNGSLTISKRVLSVVASGNKVYDATTGLADATYTFGNLVNGDTVSASGTVAFGDKNVGTNKTLTLSGTSLSGDAAGNYQIGTTSGAGSISKATLTIGATGVDKVYDTTTGATVALNDNRLGSDALTLAYGNAAFTDKNAGTGKTVNVAGITLGGTDAGNYTFNTTTATTADIAKATLTVSATGVGKTYDATTAATVGLSDNRLGNDALTLSYGSAAFTDKNAGSGKTINVGGIVVGGADAGNYTANGTTTTTATIGKATLNLAATGVDKVYDATNAATVTFTDNRLGTDALVITGNASFADKNAGNGKAVSVTGITLGGADAGNYVTTTTSTLTSASIAKASLTVGATGVDKVYDATTATTVSLNDNRLGNDALTLSYTNAAFADKNAGTGKTVNVGGIAIGGTDAGNYTVNTTATTTANVSKATLVVGAVGVDKVYDATTVGTVALTDNRLGNDVLTLSANGAFADKNAGTGKQMSVTGITASGADAANYVLSTTSATTTANISKAVLAVSATGADKVYDGTTTATASLTDNRLGSDSLTLAYGSANFLDKNAGTGKLINVSGVTMTGADAANYTVASTAIGSGNISRANLTVGVSGVDKVYDATTNATVNLSDNRIGNDALTLSYTNAAFADKNAGSNKTITVTGVKIAGADADNYTISVGNTTSTTASISKANLVVGATGVDKVYDATTAATVNLSDNRLGNDALTVAYGSAAFTDKNAGSGKTVSVGGIALGGADAANYNVNTAASTSATIAKATLTVGATGVDKVYDTTTAATVGLTDNRLGNDALTLSYGNASFADKNAGTGKTVSVAGITVGGTDAGNYTVNTTTATTANIAKAALTVGATAVDKVYDTTTAATVALNDNRLGNDALTLSYGNASFADKNAGNGKTVSVAGITVGGADAGNYTVNTTASTSANISKAALTVGATGVDKVYDTTTAATVALNDNRLGNDALTLSYGSAAFADKNAGTGKTVSVGGITIGGTDAGNYTVNTATATTASISKAALTVGATGVDKVYDTTTAATVALNDNRLGNDALTLSYGNAAFADKNAGDGKTVSVNGIALGGADAGNYTVNGTTTTTANIAKASLTVGATGVDKVYDTTTAATVALNDNRLGNDTLTLSYGNAAFADKNAGTGKTVSVAGITIAGADAGNYTVNTTAATTASISKAALTVGATGIDKVYDTTTNAAINLSDNRLGNDALTLSYGNANFADKNAGAGKTVSVSGIAIGGADAGNYTVNTTTTTTADITKAALTVGATGIDKVYDTTTVAGVNLSDNRLGNDALTLSYGSASFADKNAGDGKAVGVNGITIGGADAGNYTVNGTTTTTANISKAALTVGATGIDKVYDTTTVAGVNLSDNRLGSDALTLSYGSATFADKNAGTGKTVSVAGIAIGGADAGNYTVNTTAATTADISKASLTVSATGVDKVYDTTTAATVNLGDNRLGNDALTLSYGNAAFADKNAGDGKTVSVNGIAIGGADAGNYTVNTTAATTANIAKASLTVGATGVDKVYDTTTAATVALNDNRLGNDTLTLSYGNAAFADKNAGTGKTVSVNGITIAGTDAGNYTVNTTTATTADISKAALTVGAIGIDKVYDTTTAATVSLNDNRLGSDALTLSYGNAAFADKNAGNGKTVSVSGIAIGGTDAANYTVNTTTATTADISTATLTVGATGVDKVYDTTTVAGVNLSDNRLGSDALTLSYTNANFADKNAGDGKAVSVAGITIAGADAGNYTVNATAATTANITKAALTVGATGIDKVYDTTTTATVNLSDNRLGNDALTLSYGNANFADKNAGNGKAVSVAGITLGGADAGNYTVNTTAATTADISKAALTVSATGIDKVYDTTTAATVNLADNRLGSDVLTLSYGNAAFADKNAGNGKTVSVAGITIGGADAGNYTVNTTAATTADISKAALTVGATGIDKVYDTTTAATVALSDNRLGTDQLTLSYGNAAFADKNAGNGKTVSVAGIAIGGADAGNYTVNTDTTTTASIAKATLTVGATGVDKVYDTTTAANVVLADNRLGNDALTLSYGNAAFADKNAGNGKAVSVEGITLGGADAGNYTANTSAATTANIAKAVLTVGATGVDKVYDTTTAATVNLGDNRLGNDALTLSYGNASFADKNAGNGKTISVDGITVGGADAGNYTANTATSATANIAKAALTVGATGIDKVYDTTTAATVALNDNRLGSDALTVSYGNANFADKNAGNGKTVSVAGITIGGTDAGNYTVNTTAATTADIAKAMLTVGATGIDKVYDTTTAATVALNDNRLGNDALTLSYGHAAFADKNAGNGKTVSVSGITLGGTDAGNYTVNTTAATTADISKAALTVGATGVDKVYDTTTAATVALNDNRLGTDELTLSYGNASFADKNAGNGKTVSVNGIAIAGADAGNYTVNTTTATTADIAKATLTVGASGVDKVYDTTTAATVALSDNRLGNDALTLSYGNATFADKNAGTGKTVSVEGIAIAGADAGNYTVNRSAATTADIAKAALTVGASGVDKVYDTTTSATVALSDNRLGTDQLTLSYGNASFADKNAGNGKTVSVNGIAIGGADAGNYTVNTAASTTANIAKATLTVGATGVDKVYDTTTAATVALNDNRLGADQLTLSYGNASFADKNAGTGKTVSVDGIALGGADAGNYAVNASASTTANIAKANLTVGATGIDKVYDTTTAATVALADNRLGTDQLTLAYGHAAFADKNAGNGKTVSVEGITLGGADAGNYTVNTTAATTANIAKASLTVGATGVDKVYDTTTAATVALSDNRLGTDALTVSYGNASFADKNAGRGKTVGVTGIALGGADAGNYTVNDSTTTTADIAKANLTVGATGVDKVYDTTTAATVALNDNRLGTDQLTLAYGSAAFADKNAGNGKTVSVSGITVGGADAGNYTVNGTTTTTADVAKAGLTVGATGVDKVYDTTTAATVALNDNRLGTDQLTLSYGNASFADKNAGNGKAVSVDGITLGGADASNYTVNGTTTTTADIAKATLTVGATGVDKVYDTTTATTVALNDNRLGNDQLTLSYVNAAFADKNAGNGKTVNVNGIALGGTDAGNYTVNGTTTTTANIAKASLTVGATGVDKVYDATTAATVGLSDNRLGADQLTVSYANAAFADKNAGNGKAVNVSGITLAGADAGNYTVNTTAATTASIAKATLTISGTGVDKVYDGNTTGSVVLTDNRYAGDNLSVVNPIAAFLDAQVGKDKTLNVSGFTLAGTDAGNYLLASNTFSTTANIVAASDLPPVLTPVVVPAAPSTQTLADLTPPPPVVNGTANGATPSNSGSNTVMVASGSGVTIEAAPAVQGTTVGVTGTGAAIKGDVALISLFGQPTAQLNVQVGAEASTFRFTVPLEAARSTLPTDAVALEAVMADGKTLPAWLQFDAKTLTFTAVDAPAGALPLQALVRFSNTSQVIDVRVTR